MRRMLVACAAGALISARAAPHSESMRVLDRGTWRTWWTADLSPKQWSAADPVLSRAVQWKIARPGVESAELRIAATLPASRVRLIMLRIEPRQFDWKLVEQRNAKGSPAWEADAADAPVAIAFNAGQFEARRTWGWVVVDGAETQPPASGPLSSAFVVDSSGKPGLVSAGEIADTRARGGLHVAFQSYPTLLTGNGVVPDALLYEGRGVDLRHRDSRLAIGMMRDGRILLVLTRYDLGDGILRPIPIGPNTPEMSAIMGALGCTTAVMLDGGISSQLLYRDSRHNVHKWSAYRWVPLGLTATPASR